MAAIDPSGGLLRGLQAAQVASNIQSQKFAQDLDTLKFLAMFQKMEQEKSLQQSMLEGQKLLSEALANIDYSDDPTVALPKIGAALALLGRQNDLSNIADLFNKIKQRNLYLSSINLLDAYKSGNGVALVQSLEKLERARTGMPWRATLRGVGNKGDLNIEFTLPMEDGTTATRNIRMTQEDILRYASMVAEDPKKFAEAYTTFEKLRPEIDLLRAQAYERRTQGVQNLASADKLTTEARDIEATRPGRLRALELENIRRQLENDAKVLANAQDRIRSSLYVGEAAAKYGNDIMNMLNTSELALPMSELPRLKAYATLMSKLQLTGQNVDATLAAQDFALALKDKVTNQTKTPFTGYKIETFEIIPEVVRKQLTGEAPSGTSGSPTYPPTLDRETGSRRSVPAKEQETPPPGRVPTLEEQRAILDRARKAGLITRGYAFSSPTVPRVIISESEANALKTILGIQFTVTNEPPTDVMQTPPPSPPEPPSPEEQRRLNPWGA